MKIAVDARPLSAPLTGIGRYTYSLLQQLTKSEHEWYLYSDRPILSELPKAQNVNIRVGNAQGGTPGSLRWAQWQYVKWARSDGIDVFWSPRHHLPLLLPKEIRSVVTIHDLVWKRYPETMQRKNFWLEKLLMSPSIRMSDRIICVSDFTFKEINHFYPNATDRCVVIHEAADNLTSPAEGEKVPEAPYLLFVGTMEPRKNLKTLLEAYAELKAKEVPQLLIVGADGWGSLKIENLVRDLNIANRVAILGYVTESELNDLYRNAKCLLMPSLYEGFGLPALEAMNHGTPVIYSENTSLAEVVGPGGIPVNPTLQSDISQAIRSIAKKEVRDKLSQLAVAQSSKFSWKTAANQTLEVLIKS
ncbi:MAG: glycosyltransferase family 4 protein [Pseudomonadales bacterium]|nr:glycosyltransferase family 4 protein [Pseudomonadales bacterium]